MVTDEPFQALWTCFPWTTRTRRRPGIIMVLHRAGDVCKSLNAREEGQSITGGYNLCKDSLSLFLSEGKYLKYLLFNII